MKIKKVRADRNKLHTGKNEGHRPSSIGGMSNVVVIEWDEILAVFKNFKIRSEALLSCLNGFMHNTNRFYGSMLKKNFVVRLFSRCNFEEAIDFNVDPYY